MTGPDNYEASKTYDEFVSGEWKLENLAPGGYTVTETNANVEGYTLTTEYSVTGGKTTVAAGETAEVTVTNTYERDLGILEITKAFAGIDAGDLTEEQKAAIVFTISGPSDYAGPATVSYAQFKNGKYTLENIPTGTYKVTETGRLDVANMSLNVTYSVTNGETTVSKGNTATITVTNTYSSTVGDLVVKKAFGEGSDLTGANLTEAQKKAITFTVEGPNNYTASRTYDQFDNGAWTLNNLVPGKYTVTETNANVEGYTLTTEYSVTGGKTTVAAGETAEVTVTNSYDRDLGSLKITKAFSGIDDGDLTADQKEAIVFTIEGRVTTRGGRA